MNREHEDHCGGNDRVLGEAFKGDGHNNTGVVDNIPHRENTLDNIMSNHDQKSYMTFLKVCSFFNTDAGANSHVYATIGGLFTDAFQM